MLFKCCMKILGGLVQEKQVSLQYCGELDALCWTNAQRLWCSGSMLGYINCSRDEFAFKLMMLWFRKIGAEHIHWNWLDWNDICILTCLYCIINIAIIFYYNMFTNSWFIPKTVGLKKKTTGCSAGDRNSDKWSPQCELSLLCTLQFIVYGLITECYSRRWGF